MSAEAQTVARQMLAPDELDGYSTVIVATPDAAGRLVGRRLPASTFISAPEELVDICSCILVWDIQQEINHEVAFAGFHTGWHDVHLRPDLETLRPYPATETTAICMADVVDDHEQLVEVAPRTVLRRALERAGDIGYDVVAASELEFYLFDGAPDALREQGFGELRSTTRVRSDYSIVGQAAQEPFFAAVRTAMERAGIEVRACQAEYGLGQWEVNLQHGPALACADAHVIYKSALKELAQQHGMTASFMARPREDDMGSSCHLHLSLSSADGPLFGDGDYPSPACRHFIGGLLSRLSETAALFAPYANSYKRHREPGFAGEVIAWGIDNRTVAIRVAGSGSSLHVEHRFPGADTNPYLALASAIAAGIEGVREELDPGAPVTGSAYDRPELPRPPRTLGDAIEQLRQSEFARRALGTAVVEHYLAIAEAEWRAFTTSVSDWDRLRGLELA